MSILSTLAVALVAGAAGGAVAAALRSWTKRRHAGPRTSPADSAESWRWVQNDVNDGVGLVRGDLKRLAEQVTRIHQDLTEVMRSPRADEGPGGRAPQPRPEPSRPLGAGSPYGRSPGSWDEGGPGSPSYPSLPQRAEPYDRSASQAAPPQRTDDFRLMDDPYGAAASFDATPAVAGPPANAVQVEARDDRIVLSRSYPPEAWLEQGSDPAERYVRLNPTVALNEHALRRLSTFFQWEDERAGVPYQTLRPAVVRWDGGQGVGTLVSRGGARPR